MHAPNTIVPADPNPRERGSGPLNSLPVRCVASGHLSVQTL